MSRSSSLIDLLILFQRFFRLSFIRLLSTILAVGANLVQLGASVDVCERIKQSYTNTRARKWCKWQQDKSVNVTKGRRIVNLGGIFFLFSVFGDFCHCLLSVLLLSLSDSHRDISRLELFNLLFVFFRETSLSFWLNCAACNAIKW